MGFRYRKSINLGGGFKINLSKSGIGYSWGTKGFRITRTARGTTRRTYSIPGTGISYVEESGNRNRGRSRNPQNRETPPTQRPAPQPTYDYGREQEMERGELSQAKEAKEGAVSNALERTLRLNRIGTILLLGVILFPVHPALLLIPGVGVVLKIAAHTVGQVALEYHFDPEKEEEHTRRMDAWQLLAEGKKEWQVVSGPFHADQKIHDGAASSLGRVPCKIEKGHPYYIKTNVETIQIVLHKKERLIILPDKVFFVQSGKVRMIDYSAFEIHVSSVRFAETGPVPQDAQVVGTTWRHVNKNGTPDRRYKNNQQIPICLYGRVFLRASAGLHVELQVSNVQNARDFAELVR